MVGVDIHLNYLTFCRRHRTYDGLVLSDAEILPFKDAIFNCVLAIELLEHLDKGDGYRLLGEIERVCVAQIILSTPNGTRRVGIEASLKYETHRSGWSVEELHRRGYTVRGVGAKLLWLKSRILKYGFSFILQPLTFLLPDFSEFLIGFKDITREATKKKKKQNEKQ